MYCTFSWSSGLQMITCGTGKEHCTPARRTSLSNPSFKSCFESGFELRKKIVFNLNCWTRRRNRRRSWNSIAAALWAGRARFARSASKITPYRSPRARFPRGRPAAGATGCRTSRKTRNRFFRRAAARRRRAARCSLQTGLRRSTCRRSFSAFWTCCNWV